eukprot:COSAG02_NODE_14529_length_1262_cov_0.880482_2_plen_127_part_00
MLLATMTLTICTPPSAGSSPVVHSGSAFPMVTWPTSSLHRSSTLSITVAARSNPACFMQAASQQTLAGALPVLMKTIEIAFVDSGFAQTFVQFALLPWHPDMSPPATRVPPFPSGSCGDSDGSNKF